MTNSKPDFKAVLDKVGIPTTLLKKRNKNFKRRDPNTRGPREQNETDQSETTYRNRALERTQLKEEYRKVQEEYELLRKQTEEESRYMGGDEEHTHLVKGLDFKLLEKVKKQLENKESTEVEQGEEPGFCFTEFGFYFYKKFFYHTNLNNVNFPEKLKQTIHLLSHGYKLKLNSKIANVTYNFNVSSEDFDLPSIIINNTGRPNDANKLLNIYSNANFKKELISVFNWHQENRKKKRSERLPFRPENLGTNDPEKEKETVDSDDDIYTNIEKYKSSEYDPEVLSNLQKSQAYFDTSRSADDSADAETFDPTSDPSKGEDKKLPYKIPEKLLKRKEMSKLDRRTFDDDLDMDFSDDEYQGPKGRKRRREKRDWDKIQEMMKDKDLTIDKFDSEDRGGSKRSLRDATKFV